MKGTKFIISEQQILIGVKYALEQNIKKKEMVDIIMCDVIDEIETVLYDDCDIYEEEIEE